jgi:hypothetical protein
MSQGLIYRPKADKKKIHSRNEFELCYLRHQYLRKTDHNPTPLEMKPYLAIASHMAKNTFFTYKNLFQMVGFEVEDLISIANIHLVSFLGLFSLDKMPEKYEDFVNAHYIKHLKNPKEWDIMNKNKANCTLFLKQRMEDVVRICRQKARNIKGLPTEEYFFYYGPKKPPRILRDLIENYEKYGFRKLDTAVYKSIKKKIKNEDSLVFKVNGNYYIAVLVEKKCLSLSDFTGAGLDPYDSIHNMNPERSLSLAEDNAHWEKKQEEFNRKNKFSKTKIIKQFIEKNSDKPEYKEEIKTAKKILKNIGV